MTDNRSSLDDTSNPFRYWEADLAHRPDPELHEAWAEACRADAARGGTRARMDLFDRVRSGAWARERRRSPPAGARRGPRVPVGPEARSIGAWVRSERVFAGLTQAELAESTGLPRMTVSRIERGERALLLAEACAIADVLGLSIEAFRPPGSTAAG